MSVARIKSTFAMILAFSLSLLSLFGFAYYQILKEVRADAKSAMQYIEHRLDEAVSSVKELDHLPYQKCDMDGQILLRDFFYDHLNSGLFLVRRLEGEAWHYCSMFGSVEFNVEAGLKIKPLLANNEERVLLAMAKYQREGEERYNLFVGYLGDEKISSVRMIKPEKFTFFEDDKRNCRRVEVKLNNGDSVLTIGDYKGRAIENVKTESDRYPVHLTSAIAGKRVYDRALELALLFLPIYVLLFWLCGYLIRLVGKARLSMGYRLYQAVRKQELVAFYQPVVDVSTMEIVGAEALIRWVKDDGTVEQPGRFINELEQSELITQVTRSMLQQIPRDLTSILSQARNFRCSVNLVPRHLETDVLADDMERWAKEGYPCSQIALEITERLPLTQLKRAQASIDRLRKLGICIELDDAGTGYGGASYLQELHIDVMKIDKLFVDTLLLPGNRSQVLDAYLQMGQALDLEIIAEGVETQEQSDALLAKGVRFQQGYLFSGPLSAKDFVSFWQQRCSGGSCRIFDGIHGRERDAQGIDDSYFEPDDSESRVGR
ncbi:EAL domain-containing protein [Shewanella submarina]|uniref:EAL domain-containing protein n=1 Tax=Shewanella submarina TaxID=2016376 RepID=A0ABV7GHF7_9GAMM|nr:EAL domain-containing protein [Shewanella submarina]MCL1038950.1 EAL domain-containing protein [Shewanella submarina]